MTKKRHVCTTRLLEHGAKCYYECAQSEASWGVAMEM